MATAPLMRTNGPGGVKVTENLRMQTGWNEAKKGQQEESGGSRYKWSH
jgi:hypothetical protein